MMNKQSIFLINCCQLLIEIVLQNQHSNKKATTEYKYNEI